VVSEQSKRKHGNDEREQVHDEERGIDRRGSDGHQERVEGTEVRHGDVAESCQAVRRRQTDPELVGD
jgi:hypothetical protein